MKTLLLIRHAKSSWHSDAANNVDRPLNDRGKNDAPEMAKRLIKRKINIDAFISSPAKRAKKTAELFMKEFKKNDDELTLIPELYEASIHNFYHVIETINDKYDSVAIFSHNNGITEFANLLVNQLIDNMPTCSIFAIEADIKNWKDFDEADKRFLFFDYPKNR